MKRVAATILLIAVLGLPSKGSSFNVESPHSPAEGFSCINCHTVHATLGSSGYNNVCLTCHRPGVPLSGNLPMVPADAANPYGNYTGPSPLLKYQISHRWEGSDIAPQAGAQPPVFPTMTAVRGKTGGMLACVRCHNPHVNSIRPFLRMPMDQDQLCLDCHRSRNTRNHLTGTHPVNFGYGAADSKAVLQPGTYYNPPRNANPSNPTSNLGAFFKGGKVVCSTCHRVHNADSSSLTYDSYSTYYTLTATDGNILRTDPRGAAVAAAGADKINICTNCHAGKLNHNGKGQDVQCLDCHGAHVDLADGSAPNSFLLRRFVTFSTSRGWVRNKPVFTSATSALSANFKDANGTGVCQACHEVPLGVSPKHSLAQAQARDCQDCHYHGGTLGSFSGGCGACHGYPITQATIGGPNGLASPATGALGASPSDPGAHGRHVTGRAIQCVACHYGYSTTPMGNANLEMGFGVSPQTWSGFAGTVATGTINVNGTLNSGYSWKAALGTTLNQSPGQAVSCNVYCHGSTLSGGSVPAPVWTGGPSQAVCGSCHGASAVVPPLAGSHRRHAGSAAGGLALACSNCHGDIGSRPHVNGTVFWDLTPLGGALYRGASTGATGDLAPSASYGQCTNLYCHSPGTSFAPPYAAPKTVPTWGGTLPAGCGGCHGGLPTGPDYKSSAAKFNSHPTHAGVGCNKCHGTVTADGATITNPALHLNKSYEVAAGGGASFTAVLGGAGAPTSCSNISCHGGTGHNASWGGALGCQDCHLAGADLDVFAVPFTTGSPMSTVGSGEWTSTGHGRVSGSYRSGNRAAGFSGAGQCLYCHDGAVSHNSAANAFRLLNYSSATWGRNQVCQSCHATDAAGVTVAGVAVNAATKIGSGHLGGKHGAVNSGGQFCWDCHDAHGDVNDFMIHALVAKSSDRSSGAPVTSAAVTFLIAQSGTPAWSDFVKNAPGYGGICQACHSATGTSAVAHFTATSYDAGHNPGSACTSCHSHSGSSRNLAFQAPAGGSCDVCHGYPPVPAGFAGRSGNWSSARLENYPGGGGAHALAKHVAPAARANQGFANCDKCHSPADHLITPVQFLPSANVKVRVNGRFFFTRGAQGRYSSNRLDGAAHLTGICSNISCHFGGTPKWDAQH